MLKADLIGFHTYDYVRHFISSCTRILGLEGTPYGVEENGSLIRVAAFPIGIDPLKFEATLRDPAVADHIRYLKHKYSGLKVLLGVDRLDMIKGIPQKLLAFEKFLEDYEDCRSQVVLVQIAVPSRVDVPEYQQLRSQVHEIVGRINGAPAPPVAACCHFCIECWSTRCCSQRAALLSQGTRTILGNSTVMLLACWSIELCVFGECAEIGVCRPLRDAHSRAHPPPGPQADVQGAVRAVCHH